MMNKGKSGFTLVEVIVALLVVSVALSVFMAMFFMAAYSATERQHSMIAAQLAEQHLSMICAAPHLVVWNTGELNAAGMFEIQEQEGTAHRSLLATMPETMLLGRSLHEQNINLYNRFHCTAWGRMMSPEAQAYEVTAAVTWDERGRDRMFTLTSALFLLPSGSQSGNDTSQGRLAHE